MSLVLPTFSGFVQPAGGGAFSNTYSVDFDGTDDYLDLPDSTDFEVSEFTWSAWFYCTAINRYNIIVDTATNTADFQGYILFVKNNDNKIRYCSYFSTDLLDSTTVVSANTWYHVVATHASGSDKLYVNGSLEASGSASSFSVSDAANLRIGGSQIYSLYHQGLIDEVSFFNSALSASDVTSIYNSGVPNDISSLSPIGWWRMGDNDGGTGTTITDQGSGGNDGTLTNGPTYSTDVPSFTNTYSVDFDGTDDSLDVSSTSDYAFGSSGFSISFWFKGGSTNDSSGYGVNIFDMRTSLGGSQPSLWIETKGASSLVKYYASNAYRVSTTATINSGTWYHLAITNDGSTTKIYLDGNSIGTGSDPTNYVAAPLRIGGYHGNQNYYDGLVDEFAIFNSELSASDVTAIYNSGTPADLSSLSPIGWWRMGDGTEAGSGTTVYDMSSNSNNGTLTNGPTFSTTVPS